MKNDQKISKSSIHLLKIFIFICLIIFLLRILKVKNINCLVNTSQAEEICQNFNAFKNKSLLFYDFSSDSLFEKLLTNQDKSNSYYLEKIEKKLPNTLILYLTSKPPLYRLEFSGTKYLVGDNGTVKKNIEELDLVNVYVDEQWPNKNNILISNITIDAGLHEFLSQIITESEDKKMDLREIKLISEDYIELFYSDKRYKFIIEKNESSLNNIDRIDIILKNYDFEAIEANISETDMRFKFPVLK